MKVGSLTADTDYSISIFVTDSEGRYDQAAGNHNPLFSVNTNNPVTGRTVSARTVAAPHDMTMVVVGIVVGLILILLLVALYAFLRRRGLPQVTTKNRY